MRFGLIADTHGLLRPEACAALAGVDAVLHAGDIGGAHILAALRELAPVWAVRGNNDREGWASVLPTHRTLVFEGVAVHLVHDVADARPGDARVVVAGHSHRPGVTTRDGVTWVNPGSAGPRRFRLPVSVGLLVVEDGGVSVELRELEIAG